MTDRYSTATSIPSNIQSSFSAAQKQKALGYLVLFHLLVIASSNYLVQLPFTIFGFHTTWGAFTFPFIFLATDLTVRILGAPMARKTVLMVMMPALVISYILSVLFFQGEYQGLAHLGEFNLFVARIAIASFMAYLLGQILDVSVFNRLRQLKQWWIAPTCSTIFGNAIDTLAFFSIAFYQSPDAFMAANWTEIALVDYSFKLIISLGLFVPMYGVLLNYLVRKLTTLPSYNNSPQSQYS
ncbi:7-cyano-7-deazaguanine/7-aminomethyl-7-deazaguanine transporter [Photobacterium damselae subsp. damselae]|uniref:7-cyano-7-deazaguanine/7-aminomethyl-7- deazaguanine transporter n=1 Tax=Photobacterium damselae TaxID=38293 RepID=UPI0011D0B5EC|nr:7-cyano-7-deazaguanine/7-aminomethyl-7-deazaguanine transporter [Photobacterium damselae]KAB1517043.1 7-cyano-7-deazaguanine/7-aminomethyl-7-deazaguanine transporter [Photobacterium damselae subsp. damselae]NVO61879.1 7-cyano-7-deazaguanine/7-aminomethyl-7-deazaguanine transporter [Photobacterium damselae subsp. damselae]UJZ93789.1 7-cyano-7-deazaguanine/7-aminomethyl-7-deazaguanine transporter [Photobacterium damselae subsp. damselae]UJZ97770.1 7-cyano-7-deazaguanine/7-aminomethyl-7-deazagu